MTTKNGLDFKGGLEELQRRLADIEGTWGPEKSGAIQFRPKKGCVVTWHLHSGKFQIQGGPTFAPELRRQIEDRLVKGPAIAPSKVANAMKTVAARNESAKKKNSFKYALSAALAAPKDEPIKKIPLFETVNSTSFTATGNLTEKKASLNEAKLPVASIEKEELGEKLDAALEYKLDHDSELIIGLVGAVGTDLQAVTKILKERLNSFEYQTQDIRISDDIISEISSIQHTDNFDRINKLMTAGNDLRNNTKDNAILMKAAAAKISQYRVKVHGREDPLKKQAFIISSLKHPEEVQELRKIYSNGFFLIGVYASEERRIDYLNKNKDIPEDKVKVLIKRDVDESDAFGQHTRDTYHLSDFFINYDGNNDRFQHDLWRTVDLMFGRPFVTPTFDEFAMFMAFSASLRSADLLFLCSLS